MKSLRQMKIATLVLLCVPMTALSLNDMTKRKPSGMMKKANSHSDGGIPRVQKTRGFCFQFSKMRSLPQCRLS